MAVLSSDKKYVTVQKGDTLSQIALDYLGSAKKHTTLAKINNISNPNKIKIGQKIYLTTSATSGNKSGNSTKSSNKAKNLDLGLVSNVEDQLLFTWSWSKDKTENYRVVWQYATGDGVWFLGEDNTTTYRYSTYNIPSNAKKIRVRVKPIAKNKKVNNKETPYWKAEWSAWKEYSKGLTPITNPPTPSANIEGLKLTAEVNDLDIDATYIEFKVVKYDSESNKTSNFKSTKSKITYPVSGIGRAAMSCDVKAGYEYSVYCRALSNQKGTYTSDWVGPVDAGGTQPNASKGIRFLNALTETSIEIGWWTSQTATEYEIEYTTEQKFFDSSSNVNTKNITNSDSNGKPPIEAIIDGLATGDEYFFRVRAKNNEGVSAWTPIKSVIVGKKPSAPTTWSSTTTAVSGEVVNLYWVHNSEDGSSQTWADLEITANGTKLDIDPIKNTTDEEEKDKTSVYPINTSDYIEGTTLQWRVRTAGILKDSNGNPLYGEWSTMRTIDVYAPPTLELSVNDQNGDPIETLTAFPFYISGVAGPTTQSPIGYHINIYANATYETADDIGNTKKVSNGDSVYSNFFDTTDDLLIELSAGDIDLESGVDYTVACTVSMNSGLTADAEYTFNVSWDELLSVPNAEITIDSDSLLAYIRPYCEEYTAQYYKVTRNYNKYYATTELLDAVWGTELEGVFTTTGEQVYTGLLDDETEVYYYESLVGALANDVTLSVYRRESDGTFTEIATDLDNTSGIYITDPHPALDYARYRIVGKTESTGTITYYDVPGVPVGETSAVIQWDESWSNFDVGEDAIEDALEQPPWAGSIIKLPYNLDVSENNTLDVSLIEYIGRSHPVTYYGTQRGEKTSWSVEIEKSDKETLYALRRLKIWPGDVYVREPSGIGYWANIKVSFGQKHCELTIPISLDITRVEGGI